MNRLIVAAALTLAAGQAAAEVRVEVGLAALDALQVNYTLPASCSGLSFLKHGPWAGQIRARWQPLGNCGIAGSDQLARGTASCQVLSFRVPATSDKVAGYPGSFPTGEAIYAHMSNYAVGAECGPVQYSFSAPGSIATRFKLHQGRAAVDADAPALLFPKPRARGKHGLELLVTYECVASASGTCFVRTLEYRFASVLGRLADRLFVRKRIANDSAASLQRLGVVAEQVLPQQ